MTEHDYELLQLAHGALKTLCEERKERAIKDALLELRANKMSPERAMHWWMEFNAIDGFMTSLDKKLRMKKTVEEVNG